MKKIVITGGTGRFGKILQKQKTKYKLIFPKKRELDITNYFSINKYFSLKKPDYVIHLAALSRPMDIHNKEVCKSIDLNIIGTSNVTKACFNKNIKLIYFSSNYVYPGTHGNYKENDPLLPVNNYAWSKLGGEASVQMYKNSLILRICMTEKPFIHKKAFSNVITSFIYQDEVAKIVFKLINEKGIINIGGKKSSIYNFATKYNKNIKKVFLKKNNNIGMPMNSSMNLRKLVKYLNKN